MSVQPESRFLEEIGFLSWNHSITYQGLPISVKPLQ